MEEWLPDQTARFKLDTAWLAPDRNNWVRFIETFQVNHLVSFTRKSLNGKIFCAERIISGYVDETNSMPDEYESYGITRDGKIIKIQGTRATVFAQYGNQESKPMTVRFQDIEKIIKALLLGETPNDLNLTETEEIFFRGITVYVRGIFWQDNSRTNLWVKVGYSGKGEAVFEKEGERIRERFFVTKDRIISPVKDWLDVLDREQEKYLAGRDKDDLGKIYRIIEPQRKKDSSCKPIPRDFQIEEKDPETGTITLYQIAFDGKIKITRIQNPQNIKDQFLLELLDGQHKVKVSSLIEGKH